MSLAGVAVKAGRRPAAVAGWSRGEQGEGAETGSEAEPSEAGPTEAYFSYAE